VIVVAEAMWCLHGKKLRLVPGQGDPMLASAAEELRLQSTQHSVASGSLQWGSTLVKARIKKQFRGCLVLREIPSLLHIQQP